MLYHITTFGCQANEADTERIEKHLKLEGHIKTLEKNKAELIVLNACSVRQSAMDRVYARIMAAKKKKQKIILAGCILPKDKKKLVKKVDEIWHPDEYFDLIPVYNNPNTAYVPIMTGCNNYCTYCAVPFTRGCEKCRPAKEIINEIKKLIQKGYKEIWLLGQNVNAYKSGKIDFPKLLKKVNNLPGEFWIRFTSPHPMDFSDELIESIAKCDKVVKYINLPVQSGDNKILKKMNRNYTREHYIKLIKKIRKQIPCIKISTDVIVGFPNETQKQFQNTVSLFKKIGFDKAYISRYSPRPGTAAQITMKDNVSPKEKKERWKTINNIANKDKKNKIIILLGPTASGKSNLAVEIAQKYNGEIISADSVQIYKGMNIGSGKITVPEMKGIKHYLLDVAGPKTKFTAVDFKNLAEKAIKEVVQKEKMPIVCGGSGFYIHTLFDNSQIQQIKPDWTLRKKLEKKSANELFKMLKKLNKKRAKTIDNKNKRRLIRAIEIAQHKPKKTADIQKYDLLYLGIKKNKKTTEKLINKRVDEMIALGLEKEVKKLVKKYRWTSILKNTIGYKEWQKEKDPIKIIKIHTRQYAKRQMTWFKKYTPKTYWHKNKKETFKKIKQFLAN